MTGTDSVLSRALAYARHGWPVFPCIPNQKIPATAHGFRDATTDERQLTLWFRAHPDRNLAVATGTPGPDVLDVDQHGDAGNGFAAFRQLKQAGLLDGAAAYVRTPSGGMHIYFAGSHQRNGHLPGQHLDFRSSGGYVLAPPSSIGGKPYQLLRTLENCGQVDWAEGAQLLQAGQQPDRKDRQQVPDCDVSRLAAWVARLNQGNRNAGLFWAANRALESNPAADLSPLAIAARQAGLGDREIHATLASARRTTDPSPFRHDHQAEEVS